MWTTPSFWRLRDRERVGDMAYPNVGPRDQNSNHIKAIRHVWGPETVDPDVGGLGQFAPFPGVDSFDRPAEFGAATGLDLHERDLVPAPHDQIEVTVATPEPVRDQLPSVAHEPARGDAFTKEPKGLSLWRHVLTVTISWVMFFTKTTRVGRFERAVIAPPLAPHCWQYLQSHEWSRAHC